jgi:hypothetical protein
MQDLIRKLPGVVSTRVGYTGGDTSNATYRNHVTHAEGIEIVFDTAETSYRRILEYFFQIQMGGGHSCVTYLDARIRRILPIGPPGWNKC